VLFELSPSLVIERDLGLSRVFFFPDSAAVRERKTLMSGRSRHLPDADPLFNRRELIRIGGLWSFGSTLPLLFEAQAAAAREAGSTPSSDLAPIRSCIMYFLYGGPSHIDTVDMKPDAPVEIRGDFQPIATSVPGLRICEHLPRLAKWMHRIAVIRSVHHQCRLHDAACTHTITGRVPPRGDGENFSPPSEDLSFPSQGAIVSYLRRQNRIDLPYAALPFFIHNLFPPEGQAGGFLGSGYAPFLIKGNSTTLTYDTELRQLPEGLTHQRLNRRTALLREIDGEPGQVSKLRPFYDRAFDLLDSEKVRRALEVEQEPRAVRERYGLGWKERKYINDMSGGVLDASQQLRGQNLLLARRLVEAGVPFVNVYDFLQQGANWDSHGDNAAKLKTYLLPPVDQGLSALIEDLDQRGLLDSTLVVVVGEFGRTPRFNKNAGRDHWPDCYSAILVGGGILGGAVYGSSDKIGAYPASDPVTPGDLAATLFWRFGIDPRTEIHDTTGRPFQIANGDPLRRLF
jgi:hypothetical protein